MTSSSSERHIYFSQITQLKRRIRRFKPHSLIITIAHRMYEVDKNPQEKRRTTLHDMYHMIKLSILAEANPYKNQKEFSYEDLFSLAKCYYEMKYPQYDYAKEKGIPLEMTLKWLCQWCQGPYQEIVDPDAIGRTMYLFENTIFDKMFHKIIGLTIHEFCQGCMLICTITSGAKIFNPKKFQGSRFEVLHAPKIDYLLRYVKSNFNEFRQRVSITDLHGDVFEKFSSPVLEKYPLIQLDIDSFIAPWPYFLVNRLCFGPYHTLKEGYGQEFTDKFGKRFQTYIEELLTIMRNSHDVTWFPERELECPGKCPDFAILAGSDMLMIECKGIEEAIPYIDKDRLKIDEGKKLGNAVSQCFEFHEDVKKGLVPQITQDIQNCYCLVVTYRRFFFANTKFYKQEVIIETQKKNRDNLNFKKFAEQCQIVDIKGFERLIALCCGSKQPLTEILQRKIETEPADEFDNYLIKGNEQYIAKGIPEIGGKFRSFAKEIMDTIQ